MKYDWTLTEDALSVYWVDSYRIRWDSNNQQDSDIKSLHNSFESLSFTLTKLQWVKTQKYNKCDSHKTTVVISIIQYACAKTSGFTLTKIHLFLKIKCTVITFYPSQFLITILVYKCLLLPCMILYSQFWMTQIYLSMS